MHKKSETRARNPRAAEVVELRCGRLRLCRMWQAGPYLFRPIIPRVPMPTTLQLKFVPFGTSPKGVLIVFCEEGVKFGPAARKALAPTGDLVTRAAAAARFQGKNGSTLDILTPAGLEVTRLVIVGAGKVADLK